MAQYDTIVDQLLHYLTIIYFISLGPGPPTSVSISDENVSNIQTPGGSRGYIPVRSNLCYIYKLWLHNNFQNSDRVHLGNYLNERLEISYHVTFVQRFCEIMFVNRARRILTTFTSINNTVLL